MARRVWIVLVALLLSVFTMPMASAARGGTDRPVRAELAGSLTWAYDWDSLDCPVTTLTESTGRMSHLGRVSASWQHCPLMDESGGYRNGHVVFTAANGDTVEAVYETPDGELPWDLVVIGGTGRFQEATGILKLTRVDVQGEWQCEGEGEDEFCLPIDPWSWSATIGGRLSY
jgi:hypothetical protein